MAVKATCIVFKSKSGKQKIRKMWTLSASPLEPPVVGGDNNNISGTHYGTGHYASGIPSAASLLADDVFSLPHVGPENCYAIHTAQ